MNHVEELLKKYQKESIWFYLEDEVTKEIFKKELIELSACWLDQSKVEMDHHISEFMAVHNDNKIAFISGFAWALSFEPTKKEYIRIHFKKYIEGNNEYLINTRNITYMGFIQKN